MRKPVPITGHLPGLDPFLLMDLFFHELTSSDRVSCWDRPFVSDQVNRPR